MATASDTLIAATNRTLAFARARPVLIDVGLVLMVAVLGLAELTGDDITEGRDADLIGVLLVLTAAAVLIVRRTAPVLVLWAALACMTVLYVRDYGSFVSAAGLPAMYSVAVHGEPRRRAWLNLAAGVAAIFGVASFTLLDADDGYSYANAISMLSFSLAAIAVGGTVRNWRQIFAHTQDRAERAEAEQALQAERAVAQERLRIAREMHDVVAHGMSLIAVQAAAAREIVHVDADRTADLLQSIEGTGRESLDEMRRMLGVLRHGDDAETARDGKPELAPQPRLADLDQLIMHCVDAGIPTELAIRGDVRVLPAGLELAAYRIVQEALTNVVKHGGTAATAAVEIDYSTTELFVSVTDTGRGVIARVTTAGSGNGLIGMRERVEAYRGSLVAGPRHGGGYEVRATLPVDESRDRPEVGSDTAAVGESA